MIFDRLQKHRRPAGGRARVCALLVIVWLSVSAGAAAQGPAAEWRVLETASFRVHYPAPYEEWTLRLAARLESIRARVAREIGYTPAVTVEVVVMDPVSAANGAALPFLGAPRMVLWTTPPAPDSAIGHYGNWGELVAVHEDAHLTHLLRPSRNPVISLLERTLLPVGPIARQAPRWVIEGYATLLEGQLTGFGRPPSDMRAAILRRWAQEGQLPPYERLSADPERWHGMSMAYLAGSAYLEWLVERGGPDSLRRLWARLTARTVRSFDAAFRGVFGDSPEALYGRFTAELVQRSMRAEEIVEPVRQDGVLWQRLERSTGVPALSADGRQLAVVLREHRRPARLAVFSTAPDEEAERERRERIERMLERDPEDFPPVRDEPLPRTPVQVLPAIHGAEPHAPRWMPDGGSMLFVRFEPDRQGFLHPDLFRWRLETGRVERITRLAGLHEADPMPDGRSAVALRHRHGYSQIVQVNLTTGAIVPVTEASVEIAYESPRVSPDGRRLAYLRSHQDGWRAVVRDLKEGGETVLATPAGATLAHPAWSSDGRHVYLSVGAHGFIDIHVFPVLESGPPHAITRTQGAALGAAPVPDKGGLYFLGLEPRGLDLRFLEWEAAAGSAPDLPASLVPAVRVPAEAAAEWQVQPVEPGRAVGIGRQEFLPLVGGAYASTARALEVGVRGGDLLGRLNYIAIGSLSRGQRGPTGAAFAAAWRGWPVTVSLHAFTADEAPSRQRLQQADVAGQALDATRRGLEGSVGWERHGRPTSVTAGGGALLGSVQAGEGERTGPRTAFAHGGYTSRLGRDRWHASHGGDLRLDAGRTGVGNWQRVTLIADGTAGHGPRAVAARFEQRSMRGTVAPSDRILVGGMPSSLLPSTVVAGRRFAPPVPLGRLHGEEHRAFRFDLAPGPTRWFYERHRVRERGEPWSDPLSWVGGELRFSSRPAPLLFLPGAEVLAGVARILDAPEGARTRWWVGLSWAP